MYSIHTDSITELIDTIWRLIGGVLSLNPAVFQMVKSNPEANLPILIIIFLAGISLTLGQCVTLFINRVTPARFAISVLIAGLIFILNVMVQVVSIWLVVNFGFRESLAIGHTLRVVCLAYAPLILGFFVLLPYVGSLWDHLLDIWSLLAVIMALSVITPLTLVQIIIAALAGWSVFQLIKLILGRPLNAITRWLRYKVAGVPLTLTVRDFTQSVISDIHDPSPGT